MKSVLMYEHGGPEVLCLGELPDPALHSSSDVLIRNKAAGINPIDTKIRKQKGLYPLRKPTVLGFEGAGVIEGVGTDVSEFTIGDAVYYCFCAIDQYLGSYAEYSVVPERFIARKPESLSFAQAAGAPLALITAWESLFRRADLQSGQRSLIHAGAGGVGHMAIQLAKHVGAIVSTTISNQDKGEFVKTLGADKLFYYRDEDFAQSALDWTKGQGVELVLDTVGGRVFEQSFTAVQYGGSLVTLLQPAADTNWTVARQKNLRISLELMLAPTFLHLEDVQRQQSMILRNCSELFDQKRLTVHVGASFSLNDAAQAHAMLENGGITGKLVLMID